MINGKTSNDNQCRKAVLLVNLNFIELKFLERNRTVKHPFCH